MYQPDGTWKITKPQPHTLKIPSPPKTKKLLDPNRVLKKRGRKPVADKQFPLRFFIEESTINAIGEDNCKKLCLAHLKEFRQKQLMQMENGEGR